MIGVAACQTVHSAGTGNWWVRWVIEARHVHTVCWILQRLKNPGSSHVYTVRDA